LLLQWTKLVTVNFFTSTQHRTRRMLTMIYMTHIQNMSFFLLKVNNPSVCHPIRPPSGPRLAPVGHPRLAPVGHPVWPPFGPRLAPFGPLFGRSQGYKFAQICITLCPSCITSLKSLSSLLWTHCERPIVQGGFNFPILDYHDLQEHMHDQFHASTFFSSSI
jgi:hypothetical protein